MKREDADRLDGFLGGEVPLEGLPEPLRRDEARLRELLGTLREDLPAPAPAALRARVLLAVTGPAPSPWSELLGWWVRPRTIRLSPAVGALAVAAGAAVFALWPAQRESPAVTADVGEAVVTRFVLVAPEAGSVRLTGDFAAWNREGIELEDLRGTGVWVADVPLPPGVYQYTFIVDDSEWRPDPTALSQVDDGFGQVNSVIIVSSSESEA